MNLAAILLAAGGSTRMGSPKQLLPYRGVTLVRHAASTLLAAEIIPMVVVVGNQSGDVAAALAGLPVHVCVNAGWERGIGSSVRAGVAFVANHFPEADVLLIALADQPSVAAAHFVALRAAWGEASPLVASGYEGVAGVPAIFGRAFFADLAQLGDGDGAKSVLRSHADLLRIIPLAAGRDIDSPGEYDQLLRDS